MTVLVLDDVETLLAERCEVVQHAFQYLGGVALSALNLGDDAQRVARPVGLRGVAGESLVGHVRVVLERADGLDDVDVPPAPLPASAVASSAPQAGVSTSAVK